MCVADIRLLLSRKEERKMKKIYLAACVQTMSVRPMMMIAASDSITSGSLPDVTYGGVDEDGEMIPSSRRDFTWGDE